MRPKVVASAVQSKAAGTVRCCNSVAIRLRTARAILDPRRGRPAQAGRPHHPLAPGPSPPARVVGEAAGAAPDPPRAAPAGRSGRPGLRLSQRLRAARSRPAPPRARLHRRAPLRRGARGEAEVPPRHRLHPLRQGAGVPLGRAGESARRGAPGHPLPRARTSPRTARPLRAVPLMPLAAALAAFSALPGGALALAARKRPSVLERTRTFAFAAAAGVVAFHLLPEVLPEQGLAAFFWVAAGFMLP